MTTNFKAFYELTDAELNTTLPKGTYHLKVREAIVNEWPDGRAKLDITTAIVSGEKAGQYGPRLSYSLGTHVGTKKDGSTFTVTSDEELVKLTRAVRLIRNGKDVIVNTNGNTTDQDFLKAIARQIQGDEFIAPVAEDKNGYPKAMRLFSMSQPPASFKNNEAVRAFSAETLDNI